MLLWNLIEDAPIAFPSVSESADVIWPRDPIDTTPKPPEFLINIGEILGPLMPSPGLPTDAGDAFPLWPRDPINPPSTTPGFVIDFDLPLFGVPNNEPRSWPVELFDAFGWL